MRLLIVTQKVDEADPVLGFFVDWLREFAQHTESVEVICLEHGDAQLPANVQVHSLGKESGARSSFVYSFRFLGLAWKLRKQYDAVFVHMNPEYVVLAGCLWKLLGKRVALWYLHKSVTWKLRVASLFADTLVTSTAESLRLTTPKKRIVGHGIDLHALVPLAAPETDSPVQLLTVGRLSPIKRVDLLIDAIAELGKGGDPLPVHFTIVGSAVTTDGTAYEFRIREQVQKLGIGDRVTFAGPIAHDSLNEYFNKTHIFIHASDTGSLDKALLEPLAVGIPVVTTSAPEGTEGVLGILRAEASGPAFAQTLREAINRKIWNDNAVRASARAYVEENHSLALLIPKILHVLEER